MNTQVSLTFWLVISMVSPLGFLAFGLVGNSSWHEPWMLEIPQTKCSKSFFFIFNFFKYLWIQILVDLLY
ncbi:hypothetical protein RCL_jg24861.t1 [Rhizophagus clarus]|uniref:Uncharacterized protein n=1 Tax=Rhizophagus clarus TaxID=94130 RepID=A0A8H3LT78_9GLOM|nr:hypothetical protein RCL_jg24861.t1 [Rhizophagus clarus]